MAIIESGPRKLGFDAVVGHDWTFKFIAQVDQVLSDGKSSWRCCQVERREGSAIEGRGLFATDHIDAYQLVAVKGGRVVDEQTVRELTQKGELHGSQQQIGEDMFLAGLTAEEEDVNLVGYNHSCNPNALVGIIESQNISILFSTRSIEKGEEITADYSVSNMSNTHRFVCNCGVEGCRTVIQPRYEYFREDFQRAHEGEFPEYMQKKIDAFHNMPAGEQKKWRNGFNFAEIAGRITLLNEFIKKISGEKELDKERLAFLYDKFLIDCIKFASIFRFNKNYASECGIKDENVKVFQKSVMVNLPKIVAFANRRDSEQAWITPLAQS
jgi:hypothetical protein